MLLLILIALIIAVWVWRKSARRGVSSNYHPVDIDDEFCGHLHLVSNNRHDVNVAIEYSDALGQKSLRHLNIHGAYTDGSHIFLMAYCQLRKAERTFRADRIRDFIDVDGVVISTRDFLTNLGVPLWKRAIRYKQP